MRIDRTQRWNASSLCRPKKVVLVVAAKALILLDESTRPVSVSTLLHSSLPSMVSWFNGNLTAAKVDNKTILFCGVHFMAETTAIISPQKKVLIPDLASKSVMLPPKYWFLDSVPSVWHHRD